MCHSDLCIKRGDLSQVILFPVMCCVISWTFNKLKCFKNVHLSPSKNRFYICDISTSTLNTLCKSYQCVSCLGGRTKYMCGKVLEFQICTKWSPGFRGQKQWGPRWMFLAALDPWLCVGSWAQAETFPVFKYKWVFLRTTKILMIW